MTSRLRSVAARFAILLPLACALLLAGRTVERDSCTVDEFGNLPLTVAYWKHGALHIDVGNPPLTRWVQGLPLLSASPSLGVAGGELPEYETSWDLAYVFEREHFHDYPQILARARRGTVGLLLLAVAGVFVWARGLAGTGPALGASLLTAFSPNLVAHGRLVTPDVGVSAFVVWAGWAAWRAGRAERGSGARGWAVAAGGLAAAAALSKFTGLLLLPALAAALTIAPGGGAGAPAGGAAAARRAAARRPTWRARFERPALFLAAALVGLFAGYAFPGPGRWGALPLPLPGPIVDGIRSQLGEDPYPAYLLGELRAGGWLFYYPLALLVKVPSGAIALVLLAVVASARESFRRYALPLLLAAAFFVALGVVTKKNVGVRYLLPMFPLLHVGTAAVFASRERSWRIVGGVCLGLALVSGVAASAAPLAYFNGAERFLGGKRAVLVDSNLDWGQALPDLREWAEREGVDTVQLAYFGRIDPSIYGIRWRTLPSQPVAGPVAISATFAVGRPYAVRLRRTPDERSAGPAWTDAGLRWSDAETWAWLKDLPPDEELGGGAMLVWKDALATWKRVGAERAAAAASTAPAKAATAAAAPEDDGGDAGRGASP